MKKSEVERPRVAGKMVSALAPSPAGGAGSSVAGALYGASDSDVLTDTSSVQSSDIDRASIRSVDERVEVSTYLISIKSIYFRTDLFEFVAPRPHPGENLSQTQFSATEFSVQSQFSECP